MGGSTNLHRFLYRLLNLVSMRRLDRSEYFGLYVRCIEDIIELLEQMYLIDGVNSAEEFGNLELGIDGFRFAMGEINRKMISHDERPFEVLNIKHWMGNC